MTDKQLKSILDAMMSASRQGEQWAEQIAAVLALPARELSTQQPIPHTPGMILRANAACDAIEWVEPEQPDAARGEHCPKCNFTMSGVGHCVNCAEQPARDGVDRLSGYVEYLREDKATKYSDPCNAAVQTERLRIAEELEAITQRAGGEVTEEMVERAWLAFDGDMVYFEQDGNQHKMRAALEAALSGVQR